MRTINTTTANIINRTPAVTAFLASARKYNVLTAEEELAIFARIAKGDEAAKAELVNHNLRFIFSLASCFAKGDEIMDLVSIATIGMYNAIDSFESARGFRFLSYAVHYMRAEISEYYRTDANMVRKGYDFKAVSKANKVANKFFAEQGRMPSEEELIDILNTEYNMEIKSRMEIVGARYESMDEEVGEDGDTAGEIGELATRTASVNDFEGEVEREQTEYAVNRLIATLTPKEQNILRMAYGLTEDRVEYDDESIALRYGLTAERVRQIKVGAVKKLKEKKERVLASI